MSIQITSDIIRRFPFAVRPDRITEADEAWIAAEMAKTIKQEQRDNGEKPGGQPLGMYTHNVASQAKIDMLQNQIVLLMRDGETRSIKQMATFANAAMHDTRTACLILTQIKTLERVTGNNRSNIGLYRHTSAINRKTGKPSRFAKTDSRVIARHFVIDWQTGSAAANYRGRARK